jgi:hypothetical protein
MTAALDPVMGLRAKLSPCPACGCVTARFVQAALVKRPLRCERCNLPRGELTYGTQRFIRDFIKFFGRPTSPIEIREQLLRPPGASAATSSPAPTES